MIKKFLLYFSIFFVISFSILNSRFISAEFRYWLDPPKETKASDVSKTAVSSDNIPRGDFSISIPSIEINAPIVLEKSLDSGIILKRLEDGVVHYSYSPLPGEKGTSIILGHSSAYPWYRGKYGSVFALLSNLKKGDAVNVSLSN